MIHWRCDLYPEINGLIITENERGSRNRAEAKIETEVLTAYYEEHTSQRVKKKENHHLCKTTQYLQNNSLTHKQHVPVKGFLIHSKTVHWTAT